MTQHFQTAAGTSLESKVIDGRERFYVNGQEVSLAVYRQQFELAKAEEAEFMTDDQLALMRSLDWLKPKRSS